MRRTCTTRSRRFGGAAALAAVMAGVTWTGGALAQGVPDASAPEPSPAAPGGVESSHVEVEAAGSGPGEAAPAVGGPAATGDAEGTASTVAQEPSPEAAGQEAPPELVAAQDADARIAALEERIEGLEAALYTPPAEEHQVLRIYGFADAGFRFFRLLDGCTDTTACIQDGKTPSRFRNLIEEHPTFVLGNLNLYFDAEPVESFRLLTEVRFTRYPQGNESGLDFERQDNEILDTTSPTGRNHVTWSGIVLERAQFEWNRFDRFRIIAGYFLTPYGIWNVDHGTPTLISLALPDFFAQEYIPTHLTGIQALGRTSVGSAALGYHAYLANGRTPSVLDNNQGKGLGGRAYLEWQDPVRVTVGASGYYEHYSDRTKEVVDLDSFIVDSDPSVEYDEWSIASDLSLDVGQTRVRAEWILNRVAYEDGFRESPVPTRFAPDRWRQNFYVLVAHEIGKTKLEPYVYGEYARRAQANDRASSISSVGANYSFNPYAKLKAQAMYTRFYKYDEPDAPEVRQNDFISVDTRFVMAF